MSTQLACSACPAVFSPDPKFCPSCGLHLAAQAIPVVKKESPPWWFLLKIGLGIGLLAAVSQAFNH
jgi:predicted amidophosphoribosyltransferase